jgi:hypothetical protein
MPYIVYSCGNEASFPSLGPQEPRLRPNFAVIAAKLREALPAPAAASAALPLLPPLRSLPPLLPLPASVTQQALLPSGPGASVAAAAAGPAGGSPTALRPVSYGQHPQLTLQQQLLQQQQQRQQQQQVQPAWPPPQQQLASGGVPAPGQTLAQLQAQLQLLQARAAMKGASHSTLSSLAAVAWVSAARNSDVAELWCSGLRARTDLQVQA